jgi:hypothetical protein
MSLLSFDTFLGPISILKACAVSLRLIVCECDPANRFDRRWINAQRPGRLPITRYTISLSESLDDSKVVLASGCFFDTQRVSWLPYVSVVTRFEPSATPTQNSFR